MKAKWRARSGIDTGGGNGIYWVRILKSLPNGNLFIENLPEAGRKEIPRIQSEVERDLVYPLLRGKDVERWKTTPVSYIIVPHGPTTGMHAFSDKFMKINYPKTYNYFMRMKSYISCRRTLKIFGGSTKYWYSLFKIGKYTFAPHKVVWREIAKDFVVSTVSSVIDEFVGKKNVLPDHKLMLTPCKTSDEAFYLCAILNSCVAKALVKSYAIETQISTHVLKYLKIPTFDKQDSVHKNLVLLSKRAHEFAIWKDAGELAQPESKIDKTVAFDLYGLSEKELSSLKETLKLLLS
jgi:hypothetical protein